MGHERSRDFVNEQDVFDAELMTRGICPKCQGTGKEEHIETMDRDVIDRNIVECSACKGTGKYELLDG